jgi:cyanophycinase
VDRIDSPAPQRQPLYLLADSQLLFWKRKGRLLLDAALAGLSRDAPICAAYVGASNGDRPEFYDIFEAAVDALGLNDRRMVDSSFPADDRAFLERARLVVLAGGDVRLGWNTFEESGMKDVILSRYAQGAVLVGISAGAIQLGRYGIAEAPESCAGELLEVFGLVPAVVDTHDEQAGWERLSRAIRSLEGRAVGLGIPSGGGVVVHPDATTEPVRKHAREFRFERARLTQSVLHAASQD